MIDTEHEDDLLQDIAAEETLERELSFLFGEDIVEQAKLIDIADLNMTDDMAHEIGEAVRHLKVLQHDPGAQQIWVSKQPPGLRLLLCLWIMDMDLLDKIRSHSYLAGDNNDDQ